MTSDPTNAPRIAVVGCGAIAESFHLPALARDPAIRSRAVLVDPNAARARELAARFGAGSTAADLGEVLGRIDGAIVSVPAALHHPVSLACLRAGVGVLCEKPLAETPERARELVDAAEAAGLPLAVNQTRRLFPAFARVRELVAEGAIGAPRRLEFAMGEPFDWPAATSSYFGGRGACRGVLLDTGAHIVDLVCWWLGGMPELLDYRDDSAGGTEAVADLSFRHAECAGRVRLSWLSKLENRYRIEGERGSIEGGAYEWSSFMLRAPDGRERRLRVGSGSAGFSDFAQRLVENFVDVVRGVAEPLVPGREVLASLELIDACYRRRRSFDMPWQAGRPRIRTRDERAILVTGAGGFIGGRVVERLHAAGAQVRAGVRRWSSAARIGRLPVDLVACDVGDAAQLASALDGVRGVVHCAVGERAVTVDGTRRLLEAAALAKVERVVHVSSVDVYGGADGEVREDHPLRRGFSAYADAKIDAEEVCREFVARGVPVCILRPTLVYGPFSASWTIEWAVRLQQRPWLLAAASCQGTCNLLYVDDLVSAVQLALDREEAAGAVFQVNGSERPSWQEYFEALNAALGLPGLEATSPAASRLRAALMQPVRSGAKLLLSRFEKPILTLYQRSQLGRMAMLRAERAIRRSPTAGELAMLGRRVAYPADRIAAELGFAPRVALDEGLERSVAWLRHHGYVASAPPA